MPGIATLREKFGLSQRQMASYLGVSASIISMAEKAKRYIPTHAILKMAEMEKSSAKIPGRSRKKLQPQVDQLHKEQTTLRKQYADYLKSKAIVFQNRLDKLTTAIDQTSHWLDHVDRELSTTSAKRTILQQKFLEKEQAVKTGDLFRLITKKYALELEVELAKAGAEAHKSVYSKLSK